MYRLLWNDTKTGITVNKKEAVAPAGWKYQNWYQEAFVVIVVTQPSTLAILSAVSSFKDCLPESSLAICG